MSATLSNEQRNDGTFDLVRVSKSKEIVDLAPNTIRAYAAKGLSLYRKGKVVFFSKTELAAFIRN